MKKPRKLASSQASLTTKFNYQSEQLRDWVTSKKAYGTNEVLFAISPKFIK